MSYIKKYINTVLALKCYCWSILLLVPIITIGANLDKKNTWIYLMGDSVLDNFYWLEDKKKNLTQQLEALGYTVNNYAVDESRIEDIRKGKIPRVTYIESRRANKITSYPQDDNEFVKPLQLFEEQCKNNNHNYPQCILMSAGGNNLVLDKPESLEAMIKQTQKIEEEYQKIIDEIHSIGKRHSQKNIKIILVMPYFPLLADDIFFKSQFCPPFLKNKAAWVQIYSKYLKLISQIAQKNNCDVIDLSLTLDPYNKGDYGKWPDGRKTPIEPSSISSEYIAQLGHRIIGELETSSQGYDKSRIFFGHGENIKKQDNTEAYRTKYIDELCQHVGISKGPTSSEINYMYIFLIFVAVVFITFCAYYLYYYPLSEKKKEEKKLPTTSVGKAKKTQV